MRINTKQYRIQIISADFFIRFTAVLIAVFTLIAGQGFISAIAKKINAEKLNSVIYTAIPASKQFLNTGTKKDFSLIKKLIGFDINNPITIITSQIAVVSAAEGIVENEPTEIIESRTKGNKNIIPENAMPIEEITVDPKGNKAYISAKNIYIKNNTTYTFDTEALLNEPLSFEFSKDGPKVLIVHSHSSESFTPSDKNYYTPSDPSRTQDLNFNVTRVGEEMSKILNDKGIKTIHDRTLHDYPSYNSSYSNSLKTVEKYLKQYPSIKVVIDVHRDAIMGKNGEKLKVCTNINNEKVAQVMVLTGTNQGGLDHPAWRENLKFAVKLQSKLNELYPTLARPLNLTKERYNTHTTKASFILEVGSNGNTLEEAILGGRYAACAIGDLINSL